MTKILFATFALILFVNPSRGFDIVAKNPDVEVVEGATVDLYCKSDDYWEYCEWARKVKNGRDKPKVCNFEWKRAHDAVKKTR